MFFLSYVHRVSRTLLILEADGGRRRSPAALLDGRTAWSLLARATHANRALGGGSRDVGRVTASYSEVGRTVRAGATLVELDASTERMQTSEERSQIAAIVPQVESRGKRSRPEAANRDELRRVREDVWRWRASPMPGPAEWRVASQAGGGAPQPPVIGAGPVFPASGVEAPTRRIHAGFAERVHRFGVSKFVITRSARGAACPARCTISWGPPISSFAATAP